MSPIDPETVQMLRDLGCTIEPCGSRVTCSPAPRDTDADFLVEVPRDDGRYKTPDGAVSTVVDTLCSLGFYLEGGGHYQNQAADGFASLRLDEINLLVSVNPDFCRRHRAATHTCKRLNILNKNHRITVFQAVLYGHIWEPEAALPVSEFEDLL